VKGDILQISISPGKTKRTHVQIVNHGKCLPSPEAQDEIQGYKRNTQIKVWMLIAEKGTMVWISRMSG
jgi:aconitate hydratase 2/2-methylisocitrate dehydratase